MKIITINRFFNILLGALAMVAVAIFSAYLAMRIAIHGREVEVPELTKLSLTDAQKKAASLGLRLNVESRFYSASVPGGTVIGQSPAPGAIVRRQFAVRITESLGPQQVAIPSLTGQTERLATIALRQLALELGATAYLPAPGPAGVVLAQTPLPSAAGASGIDTPRVSLLLTAPDPETFASAPNGLPSPDQGVPHDRRAVPIVGLVSSPAFVMPTLTGLTLTTAAARAANAGLHVISAEEVGTPLPPATTTTTPPTQNSTPAPSSPNQLSPTAATAAATPSPTETVVAQAPPAGHRVQKGDPVKLVLNH